MAVYFVQCRATAHIKIGFSEDAARRVCKINADSPAGVDLIGVYVDGDVEDEAALHVRFAERRVHGEWFKPDEVLLALIACFPVPTVERFGGFDGTKLTNTQIVAATGLSKSYVSDMRRGFAPITVAVAAMVFEATGVQVGPLRGLEPREAELITRVCSTPYHAAQPASEAA